MEVAWTTVLIIALLLPGVFFFIGYSSGNRYSREVVKSSAIGEVGLAVFIAISIHLYSWGVLRHFGFDLTSTVEKVADYGGGSYDEFVGRVIRLLPLTAAYVLVTALVGLGLGCLASWAVSKGYLPLLVTHKWINQVRRSMNDGLVTAYVMTTTMQNNKVLMYKGVLAEFFQKKEGQFEYVVLSGCSSYFMTFDEASPHTGTHKDLFSNHPDRPKGAWDFLQIEGANIANILFDPSEPLVETTAGTEALDTALKTLQRELDRLHDEIPNT